MLDLSQSMAIPYSRLPGYASRLVQLFFHEGHGISDPRFRTLGVGRQPEKNILAASYRVYVGEYITNFVLYMYRLSSFYRTAEEE